MDLRHKSVKTFIVCIVCGLTYGGSTFASFKTGGTGSGAAIATTSSDIQGYFPNVAENADEAVTAAQNGLYEAQIDEVLGGMSATSSVDLNNAVNLDYVQHCILN